MKRNARNGQEPGMPANKGKWATPKASSSSHGVTLDCADAAALGRCVMAVVLGGDAIMFSHTRHGGAVRLVIFSADEKHTFYANNAEELESLLENITHTAENAPEAF